jgi:hypothetical protein
VGEDWTPADPTTSGSVSPEHWYRADLGIYQTVGGSAASSDGDPVGQWQDQATSGDHVASANNDYRPTLQTNELNGQSVLRFDGTNDCFAGAFTNGGALSQPFTAFLVAKSTDTSVTRCIINGDDPSNEMAVFHHAVENKWGMWAGGFLVDGAPNTDWQLWTVLFNSTSSQFWHGGISKVSGNAGTQNPDGIAIGSNSGGTTEYWKGDIAEIIIYNANLSDADKDEVGNYLSDRYGISYTDIVPGAPNAVAYQTMVEVAHIPDQRMVASQVMLEIGYVPDQQHASVFQVMLEVAFIRSGRKYGAQII